MNNKSLVPCTVCKQTVWKQHALQEYNFRTTTITEFPTNKAATTIHATSGSPSAPANMVRCISGL